MPKLENETDYIKFINVVLNDLIVELKHFDWDSVPEFDQKHYTRILDMLYDGACSVKTIPISDGAVKHELWDRAKCYTVSDSNGKLAYTFLVGMPRGWDESSIIENNPIDGLSATTQNALGLHVGGLDGVKLQDNAIAGVISTMLFDIMNPYALDPELSSVVKTRIVNNSQNVVKKDNDWYVLQNKYGGEILRMRSGRALAVCIRYGKLFLVIRNTARHVKYPRGGVKIFDKMNSARRRWLFNNMLDWYEKSR